MRKKYKFIPGVFVLILLFWALPALSETIIDTAWVRRYNGPLGNNHDEAHAIAVDRSGNIVVTGRSVGSGTSYDFVTTKYYADGDTAWLRRYNGPGNSEDYANTIAVDDSGNIYVAGYGDQDPAAAVKDDYVTIKYDRHGNQLWVRTYNGPPGGSDHAFAMALDGYANIYVTGASAGSSVGLDFATVKYDSAGTHLWVKTYNGPGNGDDWATSLAVDGSGNVCVTGYTNSGGVTGFDICTIKYYPNGDTAWLRTYSGSGNNQDAATAIAIDDSNNVYVTGFVFETGPSWDIATLKYNPNGNLLWAKRYNGSANSIDLAYAIAIDTSRNAYVAGYSLGSGTSQDYIVIKYLPQGDTAWVRRHNGTANGNDQATAVALDGSGNVFVTGAENFTAGSSGDYSTVKYNPAGDKLWVRTYDGPGNNEDIVRDIIVDRFDNVYITGRSTGSGS